MLKTVSSITNAIGALNYKGTWNASTNTPTLADGTGAKGDYYVVSTAGTQTFDGILLFFGAGDWIVYNGAVWQRVEGGSDGNFSNVTLNSTDAGATAGPLLDLYRNSASPAASDTIGEIEFNGQDSAGNKQQYALIHGSILSPTSTTEQGQIHFETATAGASTEKMIIGTTNLVINEIGAVFNVRIEGDTDANLFYTDATNSRVGVGTISPAAKLDVNGEALINGLTIGRGAGAVDTNTAIGASALANTTTGLNLSALGSDAGKNASTAGYSIYIGARSASAGATRITGSANTAVGEAAGRLLEGATQNNTFLGQGSGSAVTTGSSHTILGRYTGVSGSLDISTATGYVVLADGSATIRCVFDSSGIATIPAYGAGAATFSAAGVISSVSDETWKVKDGVPVNTDAMLKKLKPGYWYYNDEKKQTFGSDRQLGFYAQNVNFAIGPEAAPIPEEGKPWGYYDRSVLAIAVMSLQKALATIESLTARINALERA